jgi:hypothetical protein
VALDTAHPLEGFDASLQNAADYMVLYEGYGALAPYTTGANPR